MPLKLEDPNSIANQAQPNRFESHAFRKSIGNRELILGVAKGLIVGNRANDDQAERIRFFELINACLTSVKSK